MTINPAAYLAPPANRGFPEELEYDSEILSELEQWLIDCKWEKKTTDKGDLNTWWLNPSPDRRGSGKKAWAFRSAVYQNAMWETAKKLRTLGWFAPHKSGTHCGLQVAICRPPGSFISHLDETCTPIKGKKGRWMTLREAATEAGLLT